MLGITLRTGYSFVCLINFLYIFISQSAYFRGWPSVRKNNIAAKSANSNKLRKARLLRLPIILHTETNIITRIVIYLIHDIPQSTRCHKS